MVGRHLLVRPKALMVGTVRPKERKSTCGRCGLALVMGSFKRLNPIGRVARVPQMAGAAPPNPLGPVPPQANRKPHLVRVPSSDHLYVHQQRDPLSGEHVR
ncbi:hypothetical protein BHE74_00035344 [Ensete ventricosum]|nr:hypothetical protein BHE74_00035344 [Ensete ventricosum]